MKRSGKGLLLLAALVATLSSVAQKIRYTPANLHAHNDYEKPFPFRLAFREGFGSIEADIFLENGKLLVAHTKRELNPEKTLATLYLNPLDSILNQNKGHLSKDTTRQLQLLIDIKSEAITTLQTLIELLTQYPAITHGRGISIVISGNRPAVTAFSAYPDFIRFDGVPGTEYPVDALAKVPLFSQDIRKFTTWNGKDSIPGKEKQRLDSLISSVHALGKKIRFWSAPDTQNAWDQLMQVNVDWINTDHVSESAQFMRSLQMRTLSGSGESHNSYPLSFRPDSAVNKPKTRSFRSARLNFTQETPPTTANLTSFQ